MMYKNTYNKVIDVKNDIDLLLVYSNSKIYKAIIKYIRKRSYKKIINGIIKDLNSRDIFQSDAVDVCEFIYKVIGETKLSYNNNSYRIVSNGGCFMLTVNRADSGIIHTYRIDIGCFDMVILSSYRIECNRMLVDDKKIFIDTMNDILKYYLLEDLED